MFKNLLELQSFDIRIYFGLVRDGRFARDSNFEFMKRVYIWYIGE